MTKLPVEQETTGASDGSGCGLILLCLLLGIPGVFLALAIHSATWPIWLLLALCGLGWYGAARRQGPWWEANRTILMAATFGLAPLFLVMVVLNWGHWLVGEETVRSWEEVLIAARLSLQLTAQPSLTVVLTGLCLALALSWWTSRPVVSLALTVQRWTYVLYLALLVLTSFTLFSPVLLEARLDREIDRNRSRLRKGVSHYELSLRQEMDAVAKYLAVRTLESAVREMSEEEGTSFRSMFASIGPAVQSSLMEESLKEMDPLRRQLDGLARYRVNLHWTDRELQEKLARETASSLGRQHGEAISGQWNLAGPMDLAKRQVPADWANPSAIVMATPEDEATWRSQRAALETQEQQIREQDSRAKMARGLAEEARTALETTFCEVLGLGLGLGSLRLDTRGLAGEYISSMVEALSVFTFQRLTSGWYEKGRPQFQIGEWLQRTSGVTLQSLPWRGALGRVALRNVGSDLRPEVAMAVDKEIREQVRWEVERQKELAERQAREAEAARRQQEREAIRTRSGRGKRR